jgi:hypothetical protein
MLHKWHVVIDEDIHGIEAFLWCFSGRNVVVNHGRDFDLQWHGHGVFAGIHRRKVIGGPYGVVLKNAKIVSISSCG